jgi:hypothetical protein
MVLAAPKASTGFISITIMKNAVFIAVLPHTEMAASRLLPGSMFTVTEP